MPHMLVVFRIIRRISAILQPELRSYAFCYLVAGRGVPTTSEVYLYDDL